MTAGGGKTFLDNFSRIRGMETINKGRSKMANKAPRFMGVEVQIARKKGFQRLS